MPLIAEMPDLDAAMSRLEAAESAENQAIAAPEPEVEPNPEQPQETAPEAPEIPDNPPADTPAEAEPKPSDQPETKEPVKPDNRSRDSKFAKDKQRRDDSWKALNAEKEAHKKAQADLQAERTTFEQQQRQFQAQKAKQSAKFTPEQYEQGAKGKIAQAENYLLQADGLERRAEQLEDAGKLVEAADAKNKAQQLKDAAAVDKAWARQMMQQADHLRRNPDPTAAQIQQKQQADLKHYTLEAAKNWPDLTKDGSEFQKTVAGHLKAAQQQGLDVNENPLLMYHAARLTAAETAAARVPTLDKENRELKAKVKELEALVNPSGGDSAHRNGSVPKTQTDGEEEAELRQMAIARS